jgi:hypothetical protein
MWRPLAGGGRSRLGGPAPLSAGTATACGLSVGAWATARKPLALLGLGLTSALRVRSAALLAPFVAFVSHQPAREGRRRTP